MGDAAPAWSPDGTRIAFESDRDGRPAIRVVDADGAGERHVTLGSSPAWSPDGRVTFAAEDGILSVDPDGGARAVVYASPGWSVGRPAWSRSGALALVHDPGGYAGEQIWVIAPTTGRKTVTASTFSPSGLSWSPDGSRIAFDDLASNPERRALFVVRAEEAEVPESAPDARLEPSVRQLPSAPGSYFDPSWSPDGRRIVAERLRGATSDLVEMWADGSRARPLTRTRRYDEGDPAWSPDGSRIVFARAAGPCTSALFVMTAEGTRVRRLTDERR